MKQTYNGWVIRLSYDYPALAGVLFWGETPNHIRAVRTAIFSTREEARKAKKILPYGDKILKAKITIETK